MADFPGAAPLEGTEERLTTIRSLDLILDGTEQIIAFDPAQTLRSTGVSINASGNLLFSIAGFYSGDMSLFINKSTGVLVSIAVWLEIKPFEMGVFELLESTMANPSIADDGGQSVILSGSVDVLPGDEIRIKIERLSGDATLTTNTHITALGTVSQFASSLQVCRVGPKT